MSLKTWSKEFLHKKEIEMWQGLLPENLKKHSCHIDNDLNVTDKEEKEFFTISGSSSMLCQIYSCQSCILTEIRCRNCYTTTYDESISPWESFRKNHDPNPMITILSKVKKQLLKRDKFVNTIKTKDDL
mgnify:FL=1